MHTLWKSWKPWARISPTRTKAPYGAVRVVLENSGREVVEAPGAHFIGASATCLLFLLSGRRQRVTTGDLIELFQRPKNGSERC